MFHSYYDKRCLARIVFVVGVLGTKIGVATEAQPPNVIPIFVDALGDGDHLFSVRVGKWKLHVKTPPIWPQNLAGDWVDSRGPDGATIIAPYEQATPADQPDALTGDAVEPMVLFDPDPTEQKNVAAKHPPVVQRLKAIFDKTVAETKGINQSD